MTLRTRQKRGVGPEFELVERVLATGLPFCYRNNFRIFQEPDLPTGYPDIVAAIFGDHGSDPHNRSALSLHHIKVLHYLYKCRRSSANQISENLLVDRRCAERIVADLFDAQLIHLYGERVAIKSLASIFRISRLIAIEAKIGDWKTAIHQAVTNTWFASHSYILIPEKKNLEEIVLTAKRFGIGVLTHRDASTRVALKATEHSIPSSYGSWLFNEWVTCSVGV